MFLVHYRSPTSMNPHNEASVRC
uniref:Uncharacterized protein n=1 Tax=Anguilla anguilla TaxID=7936 RepID=A0A0E9RCR7_ANGAN